MSTGYEYRPLKRLLPDGEWRQIYTGSGREAYVTKRAASCVLTRNRRADAQRAQRASEMGRTLSDFEYKVQRRPLGDWEDLPESG